MIRLLWLLYLTWQARRDPLERVFDMLRSPHVLQHGWRVLSNNPRFPRLDYTSNPYAMFLTQRHPGISQILRHVSGVVVYATINQNGLTSLFLVRKAADTMFRKRIRTLQQTLGVIRRASDRSLCLYPIGQVALNTHALIDVLPTWFGAEAPSYPENALLTEAFCAVYPRRLAPSKLTWLQPGLQPVLHRYGFGPKGWRGAFERKYDDLFFCRASLPTIPVFSAHQTLAMRCALPSSSD